MLRARHLRRALLAGGLGVITTVGGAWYLGSKPWNQGSGHYQLIRMGDQVWDLSLAGRNWSSREAYAEFVYSLPDQAAIRAWDDEYRRFGPGKPVPEWMLPGLRARARHTKQCVTCVARGWPYLALAYEAVGDAPYWSYVKNWEIRAGFRLFKPKTLMAGVPTAFPLRPLWPGFLANSALGAGAWLILLYAATGVMRGRGWLRLRRGLCPKCAYQTSDRAGRRCPECGWSAGGGEAAS